MTGAGGETMPTFTYRGRGADTRLVEGTVYATDKQEALNMLEKRGVVPSKIERQPDSPTPETKARAKAGRSVAPRWGKYVAGVAVGFAALFLLVWAARHPGRSDRSTVSAEDDAGVCSHNLQKMNGAKEQAAMAYAWKNGQQVLLGSPEEKNVLQYVSGNQRPTCPAGGRYEWNPVGQRPTCSLGAHGMKAGGSHAKREGRHASTPARIPSPPTKEFGRRVRDCLDQMVQLNFQIADALNRNAPKRVADLWVRKQALYAEVTGGNRWGDENRRWGNEERVWFNDLWSTLESETHALREPLTNAVASDSVREVRRILARCPPLTPLEIEPLASAIRNGNAGCVSLLLAWSSPRAIEAAVREWWNVMTPFVETDGEVMKCIFIAASTIQAMDPTEILFMLMIPRANNRDSKWITDDVGNRRFMQALVFVLDELHGNPNLPYRGLTIMDVLLMLIKQYRDDRPSELPRCERVRVALDAHGVRPLSNEFKALTPAEIARMCVTDQRIACENHLRWIVGAKELWAKENGKGAGSVPTAGDISGYIKGGFSNLVCPAGGSYVIGMIDKRPHCTLPPEMHKTR
jgi:hypothetical protein